MRAGAVRVRPNANARERRGVPQVGIRVGLIAAGGFQANAELVARYICKHPERMQARHAGTGRGDGVTMALAAGAAVTGMQRFYGHVLFIDALTNDHLWPYPYLDSLVRAGTGVDDANAVAQLDNPLGGFLVFDHAIWKIAGRHGLIPANPHLMKEGATMSPGSEYRRRFCQVVGAETLIRQAGVSPALPTL